MSPRKIRWVVDEFCCAARDGAFGAHAPRHREALAFVLAYAPLVECDRETRETARLELVYLAAMSGAPRPIARCAAVRSELAAPAQILPATSSAGDGDASPEPALLSNPAADNRRPENRRAS